MSILPTLWIAFSMLYSGYRVGEYFLYYIAFWILHLAQHWLEENLFLWLTIAIIPRLALFLPLHLISHHFCPLDYMITYFKHLLVFIVSYFLLGTSTFSSFIGNILLILHSLECETLSFNDCVTWIFMLIYFYWRRDGEHDR